MAQVLEAETERKEAASRYNREYYLRNKEEIRVRRKSRYEGDEEYREVLKKRRRDYHHENKGEPKPRGRKGGNMPRVLHLSTGIAFLYKIGAVCRLLGRHHVTVENWVRNGILPCIFDDRGGMWFRSEVLDVCREAVARFDGKYVTKRVETESLRPYLQKKLRPLHVNERKEKTKVGEEKTETSTKKGEPFVKKGGGFSRKRGSVSRKRGSVSRK